MSDVPIRILQCVNKMDRAGLETMLMNYYRVLDRSQIQFDFLTHRPQDGAYDDEIRSLGGVVYHAPRLYPQNYAAYLRFMAAFFREHPYRLVHSHIDEMSAFPLFTAKRAGVPVRIAHAHSNSVERNFKYAIKQAARRVVPRVATDYWACSMAAGDYLFGPQRSERVVVIKNAIDVDRFAFNPAVRAEVRRELGVGPSTLAMGCIGRFVPEKNQAHAIRLLAHMRGQGADARLVLLGEGDDLESCRELASSLGVSETALFLGSRPDVERFLQAMDVLLLPSRFEGFGNVAIEAEAAGLPVIAAKGLPPDAFVLPSCRMVALDAPLDEWARAVTTAVGALAGDCGPASEAAVAPGSPCETPNRVGEDAPEAVGAACLGYGRDYEQSRRAGVEAIRAAGYDARQCVRAMVGRYRSLLART